MSQVGISPLKRYIQIAQQAAPRYALRETIDTTSVTVTFADADPDTIVRASGDWTTNFEAGMKIRITNSTSNDGVYTIATVVALTITLEAADTLAAETQTTTTTLYVDALSPVIAAIFPIGEIIDFDHDADYNQIAIDGVRATYLINTYHGAGNATASCEFHVTNFRHLYGVLGNVTDGAGDDATYDHAITNDSSSLPYYAVECISQQTQMDLYTGSQIESYTLTATQGDTLRGSINFMALEHNPVTARAYANWALPDHSATEASTNASNYVGVPWLFTGNSVSIGGTTYNSVMHDIALEISNSLARGPAFNDYWGDYITMSKRDNTIKITIDLFDQTGEEVFQALRDNKSSFAVAATFTHPTDSDTTATFSFPTCKIFNFPKSYDEAIRSSLSVTIYGTWSLEIEDDIELYNSSVQ